MQQLNAITKLGYLRKFYKRYDDNYFSALPMQNIDIDNILDINESNKIISKHSNELIQKLNQKILEIQKIYKQYKSFKEKVF